MSTYTPEEIRAIMSAPMNIGLAVAMVDMGIFSSAIEAASLSKQIAGAAQKYPNNAIIQAAFSETALQTYRLEKPDIKAEEIKSGSFVSQAIAQAQAVSEMLQDKAPAAEIEEYKQFIYDCGNAVANAAGSGLFGSGAKVSKKEADTLSRLKLALGL